jgi:hypothetical protein
MVLAAKPIPETKRLIITTNPVTRKPFFIGAPPFVIENKEYL